MFRFVALRVAQFPLVLAVIYVATFLLAWVAPGSPFDAERKVPQVVLDRLAQQFHADSAWKFLAHYPARVLLHGDFGWSLNNPDWRVTTIIGQALPVSAAVGLLAIAIATFAGVAVGALAAVRRGGAFDLFSLGVALVGISLPTFVCAGLLLAVFAVRLHLFPVGHWGDARDLVLPSVALSLMPMAYVARLTRAAMLDVVGSDYVRTARAKGAPPGVVLWKHCLRNAMLPVLGYLGPAAAYALTGSFVVEKVFNVPGLGQHFVDSVRNRDQTLILGVVMVYSVMVLVFNLLVDVAYAVVDPRIDLNAKRA